MKFTTSSSSLLHALNKALPAIHPNPVLPILEDFKLDLKDQVLTITSTNLQFTIVTDIDVLGNVDGAVCVSAKNLIELIKNIPDQLIDFEVFNSNLKITSSVGSYDFPCDDFNEFPQTGEVESEEIIVSYDFIHALGGASFCTSNDELRQSMTGVCFNCVNNTIDIVATDASKLAKFKIETQNSEDFRIIIPKQVSVLVTKLYKSGDITINQDGKKIKFVVNGVTIISSLIDARYPDYNSVIPIDNPNKLEIDRVQLIGSLKRLSLFASGEHNQVILSAKNNSIEIKSNDKKGSKKGNELLACEYDGNPIDIGINVLFMIEVISKMTNKNIVINMSTPTRAMIIDSSDTDIYLLMPVFQNT